MLPAFDAILGHKSAHSLATGPVIAEPTGGNDIFYIHVQKHYYVHYCTLANYFFEYKFCL